MPSDLGDGLEALDWVLRDDPVPELGFDLRGQIVHVRPVVSALGWFGLDAEPGEVPRLHRGSEQLDLGPRVVPVVLALDVVAGRVEDVRQRIPEGGVSGRADVERARGIGRHVFDLHTLPPRLTPPVGRTPLEDLAQDVVQPSRVEEEIDEARSGHVDLADRSGWVEVSNDGLGDLPRLFPGARSEHEREVGGPISVLLEAGTGELGFGRAIVDNDQLERLPLWRRQHTLYAALCGFIPAIDRHGDVDGRHDLSADNARLTRESGQRTHPRSDSR